MSKGAWITLVVLVVVVLGGMGFYKTSQARGFNAEARELAEASIRNDRGMQEHADYLRPIVAEFHDAAFEESFDSGGLRSQASFDEQVYLDELWRLVGERVRDEGRTEVMHTLPFTDFHPIWATPLPTDPVTGETIPPSADEIAAARESWRAQRQAGIQNPSPDWQSPDGSGASGNAASIGMREARRNRAPQESLPYEGLVGRKFAVLVSAAPDAELSLPGLGERMAGVAESALAPERTGASAIISADEVRAFQAEHPDWEDMGLEEIGTTLGATRLVMIGISTFRVFQIPGAGFDVLATANVAVAELDVSPVDGFALSRLVQVDLSNFTPSETSEETKAQLEVCLQVGVFQMFATDAGE